MRINTLRICLTVLSLGCVVLLCTAQVSRVYIWKVSSGGVTNQTVQHLVFDGNTNTIAASGTLVRLQYGKLASSNSIPFSAITGNLGLSQLPTAGFSGVTTNARTWFVNGVATNSESLAEAASGGGSVGINTNFYLAVDSAYGASGWRYASTPQGATTNNLCSFFQNDTTTASNAPTHLFMRTYQTNQQTRRAIARIWAGELTNALNQIQLVSKLQNTNDQLIIRFNDISGNNFLIITNGPSFYLTSNTLKTNTINASTNACFTILPNPYMEVICDAYTTSTNLLNSNDSMLPIINVSRVQ